MRFTAIIMLLAAVCFVLAGCTKEEKVEMNKGKVEVTRSEDAAYEAAGENPFQSDFKEKSEIESGALVKDDIKVGTGAEVKEGDTVSVHYRGTLKDGTQFDASYDRGEPFGFTVGKGSVIKGWDEGLIGMKVGGKRKLVVPPIYGYGDQELPGIPANSTLIFEIELLGIE